MYVVYSLYHEGYLQEFSILKNKKDENLVDAKVSCVKDSLEALMFSTKEEAEWICMHKEVQGIVEKI